MHAALPGGIMKSHHSIKQILYSHSPDLDNYHSKERMMNFLCPYC